MGFFDVFVLKFFDKIKERRTKIERFFQKEEN